MSERTKTAVRRPRLLFLANLDTQFWQYRSLARAAQDGGYDVVVATRVEGLGRQIADEGFQLEPLSWKREGFKPIRFARDVAEVARLLRRLRPDLVHQIDIKPVLAGSLASRLGFDVPTLNDLSGAGYLFDAPRRRVRLLGDLVGKLLSWLVRRPRTIVLLTKEDAHRFALDLDAVRDKIALVPDFPIDNLHFASTPLPRGEPVTIACAASMLHSKGILHLVMASRTLLTRNVIHRLLLVGDTVPGAPDAFNDKTIAVWSAQQDLAWQRQVSDMRTLWRQADFAVHPVLHDEGLPVSLLEAASCGRPLVATDVPGSRLIARHGINALVVPPGDLNALTDALEHLIRNRGEREKLAAASRRIVEHGFFNEAMVAKTLELYDRLLNVKT